ncbi:MAG: flagellar hook-length control protein FliK [Lachnospiraceae bacterium]|nr:flagellar hook-length control protein FliK [Lachnospiraceae bacterium]
MGLFHSIFGIPQAPGQNGTSGTKRTTFSSGKDAVTLTKGEVVKGEVTDLRSNEVTIRLDDGKTLHAKLSTAMELSIGQKAEFFVQETNDVLITLKLLSDGDTSFTESAIDKALEASGFPKSQHAANIVRALLTAGLPANKEMIQKMMQHSAANKEVDLSTLTALLKHNLPVTKENAAQLQAYRNFEHRLLGQASTLAASLTEAFSYGEASPSFTTELLTAFFAENVESSGNTTTFLERTDSVSSAILSASEPAGTVPVSDNSSSDALQPHPNTSGVTADIAAAQSITFGTDSVTGDSSLPTGSVAASDTVPRFEETLPLKEFLSEKDYPSLEKALATLPSDLPESVILQEHLTKGTLTSGQLFSGLSSLSSKGLSEKVASMLKEEPVLSDLLGKTILNRFLLSPEDLTKEDSVKDFYERTVKDLATIAELSSTESASAALKTVSDTASRMQENIQFMNTLNQIFPYVQLPLKLTEQLTHGELYVYTKKKDLSAKDKEVSILLHLDMESLGTTDIHLSLLRQNVNAKFYLSDADSCELVTTTLPVLTEALQKKGYVLTASATQRIKEPDIVTDFMDGGDTVPMKRFRFDIRA